HRDPIILHIGVEHRRADAAAGRRADDDEAVAAQHDEVAAERRGEEAARLGLGYDQVARPGRDIGHDVVAVMVADPQRLGILAAAAVLPVGAGAIPQIGAAVLPGRIDHRHPLGARPVDQAADRLQRLPAFLAAGIPPLGDAVENRFRPLAEEGVIDIDDEQRWPLAESLRLGAEAGRLHHFLVALGQELVPDSLAHGPFPAFIAWPYYRRRPA